MNDTGGGARHQDGHHNASYYVGMSVVCVARHTHTHMAAPRKQFHTGHGRGYYLTHEVVNLSHNLRKVNTGVWLCVGGIGALAGICQALKLLNGYKTALYAKN